MRVLTVLLAALVVVGGCRSTGDDMDMLDARDQVRAVVEDLATSLGGTITVQDEYVTPATETQAGGTDELVYHLSLDVAVDPPAVRRTIEEQLVDRYRERGWAVEQDPVPDVALRLTRDGALVAIRAGQDRDGALVRGTSAVVATPEGVRPLSARLPFEAYTPPS